MLNWFKKRKLKTPPRDRRKGVTRLTLVGLNGPVLRIEIHQRANFVWQVDSKYGTRDDFIKVTGVSVEQQINHDSPVKLEWKEASHEQETKV